MLFSLRMISLDAAADESTDDKALSGHTDNDLSRLGSNQQLSLPETQKIEDGINELMVENESMNVDGSLVEDTIPDCEQDMNWQDFIPNSEPPPEADTFLQQVIDSGAFQAKSQSLALETTVNKAYHIAPPRTPPAMIILFPFRNDPDFTGHITLLRELVHECSSHPSRLALVGIGGIGKTHLAIELAYRLVRLAKMSVFWVNAESQSSINESFRTIASNLSSWKPGSTEDALRISHRWLSEERNGRWILFLDGANDHSIFRNELYLPKSQNGAIIITTRRRDVAYGLTGNQQDVLEMRPMSVSEGVSLLESKLGRTREEQFRKDTAASGLVKSLGLIPLAICRAAAYIQSTPTKPPVEDDDGRSYRLDDNDPLLRHHHLDHAQIMPDTLSTQSPKSSHRGDSQSRGVYTDDDEEFSDTFMYEGDEDEHLMNQEDTHTAQSDKKGAKIGYGSHGTPSDDDMVELSEEDEPEAETAKDKAKLLQAEELLVRLKDSEEEKIKLLEFEVFSPDGSGQVLESLFRTFKSSIDAIRSQSSSATDLLSLMSFFDRRGIPKWLLRPFRRGHGARLTDVSPSEDTLDEASGDLDFLFNQDLEILLNHCLITANGTKQMFEMHGLVQLSVKKNLDASRLQTFEQQFIKRLAMNFPRSIYSSWETCEELFAHVQAAASNQPGQNLLEDFANLLHNGGRFARLQGRYEIAMQLAEQALAARQRAEKDDTKTLTLIALILMDQGLYDKAEELLQQALDACKRRSPNLNNRRTEIGLNDKLALVYKAKGRWKDAMDIQLTEVFYRTGLLGLDYPRTLTSESNLASMYRAQGQYMDAERTQKEVVDSYRNMFGPDHHLTLTSLNNLGSLYRLQGKLGEAETFQAQALVSLRMKLGGEHPDTLTCMNSLASTYRLQGRLYEAESLQQEALEMRTRNLGSDHPHTLASMNNLALIYLAQGKHQVAAKLQSEVVEVCKTKLGPEHPHTLTSLNNIALIWKAQGRDADGRWKMDECLEARVRVLGQNHPYTISSRESAESWWSSSRHAKFPDIS
ncbi:hypothetical protein THARTR1_10748 [Trichoderma harzianum]|uniref:NB-ARC domain-containing protein n=1 Tax=Trichoderma harzianum TaxID=5544 RepID=A0A2K0TLM3_TRIHA|nr:hypothetical protein THARTR1_10748 [Trichoderma harzianum]